MDPISLEDFFQYLPKLTDEQYYLFYLISRSREAKKELGTSVDRILFRTTEVDPRRATQILEGVRERYNVFTVKGIGVRREWVKIMFVLNPVNFVKTSRKTAVRFVERCGEKEDIMKIYHSEMPRNVDFRIFMLDVDTRDPNKLERLRGIKARLAITTKRGAHIHVWKDDLQDPKVLFGIPEVEVKTRDAIEYVPFIDQGDFTPQAYRIEDAYEVREILRG